MGFLELVFLFLLAGKLLGWFIIAWWIVFLPLIPAVIIWIVAGSFIIRVLRETFGR